MITKSEPSYIYMHVFYKKFIAWFILFGLLVPGLVFAQDSATNSLQISGWIPYWRSERGVESILPHMENFTEVNPFMYTVKIDGTLYPASSLSDPEWVKLKARAKELNIRFVPAVMWANADAMHTVFSDPEKRKAHISSIIREVFGHGADGIDIDYEAKYAKTRPYFSLFLKELKEAIGFNKWITCTVESRTPLDSRYSSPESIPQGIEYANDFTALNQYCDSVRFMTYDQERVDLKLNDTKGAPYVPVSDVEWVEKAIRLAMEDIDKKKIAIGIPTYGYEWDMFPSQTGSGKMQYSKLWAFNPGYATGIASKLGLTPTRNSGGEFMITFPASQAPEPPIPLPNATRVLVWSDAEAIKAKMDLAVKLGVQGVAIFKIDGGEDQGIWNILPNYKYTGSRAGEKAASTANAETRPLPPSSQIYKAPTRNLEKGMIHEDVRMLQKILNSKGFIIAKSGPGSPGNETNIFGGLTQTALASFQKSKKITPSVGYFGPKTRAAIK